MRSARLLTAVLLAAAAIAADAQIARAETAVWGAGCTEKIGQHERSNLPHLGVYDAANRTIRLTAVQGEHAPFQLVVTAAGESLKDVTVHAGHLEAAEHRLPADAVSLYLEGYVHIYAPTVHHGDAGVWPDPLVPLSKPFDVVPRTRAGHTEQTNQPIWVDILVPRQQPPGRYRGHLKVLSAAREIGSVTVELEVLGVALPAQRKYPAHVGLYSEQIARVHHLDLKDDGPLARALSRDYQRFLLQHRLDPRNEPFGGGRIINGKYSLDWSRPELERLYAEEGRCQYQLSANPPGLPLQGISGPFTGEYEQHARDYLRDLLARASRQGWKDRILLLSPCDEPDRPSEYEAIRRWSALVRSVDPQVRFAVTEQPVPEEKAWGSLVGHVNAWIVNGNCLISNAAEIQARRRAGDQVLWYISCDQLFPQPNYYIDRAAADPRMIGWITYRCQLDGILYWTTTYWGEVLNPWGDAVNWKSYPCGSPAAGEGSLLYPGNLVERYTRQQNVAGPIGSLRLALLREGLEELELLDLLARNGNPAAAQRIAERVCRDVRDFTRDPVEIEAARAELLRELHRAIKEPR